MLGNQMVVLFDCNNTKLGSAYIDDNLEQIHCDIEGDEIELFSLDYFELHEKPEEIARHLANAIFDWG